MKDSVSNARNYALRLIRYRNRSERELADRLKRRGFTATIIRDTINLLKETGFIDDISLGKHLKDIAEDIKLLGNKGTEYFLKKRGIEDTVISGLCLSDADEFERAINLISRKSKSLSPYPLETRIKKIRGILLRKGYAYDTIKKVIDTVSESHNPD